MFPLRLRLTKNKLNVIVRYPMMRLQFVLNPNLSKKCIFGDIIKSKRKSSRSSCVKMRCRNRKKISRKQ